MSEAVSQSNNRAKVTFGRCLEDAAYRGFDASAISNQNRPIRGMAAKSRIWYIPKKKELRNTKRPERPRKKPEMNGHKIFSLITKKHLTMVCKPLCCKVSKIFANPTPLPVKKPCPPLKDDLD